MTRGNGAAAQPRNDMSQFEEPEVLATFDRSFGDRRERLQLERGSYQGRATFSLRVCWETPEGQWRWSAAKPSASGKCFQSLNLKQRELCELGQALIKAAEETGSAPAQPRQRVKDTSARQRERAKFDRQKTVHGAEDDADIPF
jgi:hypothetical protein